MSPLLVNASSSTMSTATDFTMETDAEGDSPPTTHHEGAIPSISDRLRTLAELTKGIEGSLGPHHEQYLGLLRRHIDRFETSLGQASVRDEPAYSQEFILQSVQQPVQSEDETIALTSSSIHEDEHQDDTPDPDLHSLLGSLSQLSSSLELRLQEHKHLSSLAQRSFETIHQNFAHKHRKMADLTSRMDVLSGEYNNVAAQAKNAFWHIHEMNNETARRDEELDWLRLRAEGLQRENQELKLQLRVLKAELGRTEIAVDAMRGAVKGLEGWIESSPALSPATRRIRHDDSRDVRSDPMTSPTPKRRAVVRGRGRFRGKYYIGDDELGSSRLADTRKPGAEDTATVFDARELQEGVKAWLKGFRDCEEELRLGHNVKNRPDLRLREQSRGPPPDENGMLTDEEWGDFESPD